MPFRDPPDEALTLFDELRDDAVMVLVPNEVRAPALVPEPEVRAPALVPDLTQQEIGDAGELRFGMLVIERHGVWQKASTDAQPHDCAIAFDDEWTRVQIKSSQTQQPKGFYRVDLGRHRIGVQAFAVMVRHRGEWLVPWIMPADAVRTRRYIHVWPPTAWQKRRRGEFDSGRWRDAWWVVDPAARQHARQRVLGL